MTDKDFKFFLGWITAAFISTTLMNSVLTPLNKISFGLHIASGIICGCSFLSLIGLIVWKKIVKSKDK